jgi:predicted transcriptional regulator of viral defense system
MVYSGSNPVGEARPGSRAFFSAHPVFRREEYAAAVGRRSADKVVSAMLTQHLKAGNLRRVARAVFAAVPPHGDPKTWAVDRFLAASRLKPDAVIAYHSALELHGCAYTDAPDVQAISRSEPTAFETADFTCRFFKRPAGFVAKRDVAVVDRAGLKVRVTTLERTIADLFDRYDLAGGAEELFNSLALVERVKTESLVAQARGLKAATAAATLGWWLERERSRLGVPDSALAGLRKLKPNYPQYALGAKPGEAKSVASWNILVPRMLVSTAFEGA